jgi:hypothetical protein
LAIFCVKAALAQPFGIPEGTPISNLHILKQIDPHHYVVTPENTHPDFEEYIVIANEEEGVCAVYASGFTLNNDAFGNEARGVFDRISAQLRGKYGPSTHYDFLKVGSIWKEPREWAMSIHKNERYYISFWDKKSHSNLQNGIENITLTARSLNSEKTYISLRFEYHNFKKCDAKIESAGAGAL